MAKDPKEKDFCNEKRAILGNWDLNLKRKGSPNEEDKKLMEMEQKLFKIIDSFKSF